jgi:mannose-6-phosphate isomerase-like protein (cupin superfamily)
MKKPLFRNEDSVIQQKVTRPGSDGYVLFKMVFDPETGETESAVLGIHEHPAGIEPILPHYHREVEESVYVVSGEGTVKLGFDPDSMDEHNFKSGSCWFVPADCYHQIINTGSSPVKMTASYFRNDGKLVSHRVVSEELTEVYDGNRT